MCIVLFQKKNHQWSWAFLFGTRQILRAPHPLKSSNANRMAPMIGQCRAEIDDVFPPISRPTKIFGKKDARRQRGKAPREWCEGRFI